MISQRLLTYSQAINEAIDQCMAQDPNVILMGEGVPDPKGIFGSTAGLQQKYGRLRVMDMPVSENAMTGVCIGAALRGIRPILTHQRVDFSLLSMDQIINNAAKWFFMFGGQQSVPLVVRMIIGQGWGQGAQHSQSLQSLFAHIPGLKVIMPTTSYDAKGLLISAIEDNNPVICLEHRWLYDLKSEVPSDMYRVPIGKAKVIREGKDVTIVASSYMTIESLKAAQWLKSQGVEAELIDLRTLSPLDEELTLKSVEKTGRLVVADTGWTTYGVSAEIISRVTEKCFNMLKVPPQRIALPDVPTPSSPGLTRNFYPDCWKISETICRMLNRDPIQLESLRKESSQHPHDVLDMLFHGPF